MRCDRQVRAPELAHLGALGSLGLSRRQALWQVALASRPAGEMFRPEVEDAASPLVEMTPLEETVADFAATEMTVGTHPVAYLRDYLARHGVTPAARLPHAPDRGTVRIGGAVIVRQRPGTARGLLFVTLEDETGTVQAAVMLHHGTADTTVDASASVAIADALRAAGKDVTLHLYEGGPHTLVGEQERLYFERTLAFFEEKLRGE